MMPLHRRAMTTRFQDYGMMLHDLDHDDAWRAGEVEGRAVACEVIRLCVAAGRPELAARCLIEELTVDQVREVLTTLDRPN